MATTACMPYIYTILYYTVVHSFGHPGVPDIVFILHTPAPFKIELNIKINRVS